MSKVSVFQKPVKRALAQGQLSQQEVEQLMRAFTKGKTTIFEGDAITLLNWCNAQRIGAMVVDLILQGDVTPVVEGDSVKVILARSPHASPN